jgi:ligand-binding SRPBCC domain-containing protein
MQKVYQHDRSYIVFLSCKLMSTYTLNRIQYLPVSIDKAWEFFSHPANLEEITPPKVRFKILSKPEDIRDMYEGMIIEYKISPFLGIYFQWKTKIIRIEDKKTFTDIQIKGPYALWEHTHSFKTMDGGVEMTDDLKYKLPFGFIGTLAHTLFIKKQVEEIFDFRYKKVEEMFKNENAGKKVR